MKKKIISFNDQYYSPPPQNNNLNSTLRKSGRRIIEFPLKSIRLRKIICFYGVQSDLQCNEEDFEV